MKKQLFLLLSILLILSNTPSSVQAQKQRRRRREQERDITPEEIQQMGEDSEISQQEAQQIAMDFKNKVQADGQAEKENNKVNEQILVEWEEHMATFVPTDMLTLELGAGEEVTLHEDATNEPLYIRGAYFVNNKAGVPRDQKKIDLFILDPNYKVIYSVRQQEEGIFRINTTMAGQYTFAFSNMKDKVNPKEVTVAIHPGYEEEKKPTATEEAELEAVAKDTGFKMIELTRLNEMITKITNEIETLKGSQKLSMNRLRNRNEMVNYNFQQYLNMNIFEAGSFIGLITFSVYNIKQILDNRRII